MQINKELCVNCGKCINRCPVSAIVRIEKSVNIDLDACVECGVCLRSNVCSKNALYQQELVYPRTVRSLMSDVLTIAPESGISGRGTEEMKTNEVTGRFPDGTIGIAVELGRPCYGARLYNAEKIAMAVAAEGVEFESCNPVTTMMSDPKTGKFKEELLNEKVLSAIVEMTVPYEKAEKVLQTIYTTAETLDCFLSLDICSKADKNGNLPHMEIVKKMGVWCSPNGKTNVGLGRPLYQAKREED